VNIDCHDGYGEVQFPMKEGSIGISMSMYLLPEEAKESFSSSVSDGNPGMPRRKEYGSSNRSGGRNRLGSLVRSDRQRFVA
jgi:hypothetical protein